MAAIVLRLMLVAGFGLAASALAQTPARERLVELPLAATHADLAFSLTTGGRIDDPGAVPGGCPRAFLQQVERIAASLQTAAFGLYPDLAQRVPGLGAGGFDVYVVSAEAPGSASSANGRIALNSALGVRQPYDEWLAFVIAREMGHVIARHPEENSAAAITASLLMNVLLPGSAWLKELAALGGARVASSSQREVQAEEADVIALKLLEAAGFRQQDVALALRVSPPAGEGEWALALDKSADSLRAAISRAGQMAVVNLR